MTLSAAGLILLMAWEGFSHTPYQNGGGRWTIGYGHLIKAGEQYEYVSKEEAKQLLDEDADIAERAVNRLVKVPLNQGQFDALVSFVYNIGEAKFAKSTLLKKLNMGDYTAVPAQLLRWVHTKNVETGEVVKEKGLINRRNKEIALWHGEV